MKHPLIIAFFTFIGCGQSNTISDSQKMQSVELTIRSKELLQKKSLDSAAILLKTAIELDPNNYTAYNNRAYLKFKDGHSPGDVLADYKKSLEIKPDYDIALFSIANFYFHNKDYANAIEYANQLLNLNKRTEVTSSEIQHIYSIRGESYKYSQDYGKAISDLRKALQMNPKDAGANKELGDCLYYDSKNMDLAIQLYTKAINLDSMYYQAFLGRAQCYENKSPADVEAARMDYQRAVEINPDLEDIYDTKSALLIAAKQKLRN